MRSRYQRLTGPRNQDTATRRLRVFVQTKKRDLISGAMLDVPRVQYGVHGSRCPRASWLDSRQRSTPIRVTRYLLSQLPQPEEPHRVGQVCCCAAMQWNIPATSGANDDMNVLANLYSYGPTTCSPLVWIVGGQPGDSSGECQCRLQCSICGTMMNGAGSEPSYLLTVSKKCWMKNTGEARLSTSRSTAFKQASWDGVRCMSPLRGEPAKSC